MKKITQFFLTILGMAALMLISGCVKEGCTDRNACNYNSSAEKDDGTCNYGCNGGGNGGGSSQGKVTFWNNNSSIGVITVYMGGTSGQITHDILPTVCNTSGCANFSGNPGTYSYTASATTGQTWSGSATVTAGGCLLLRLI